jgi:ferritin
MISKKMEKALNDQIKEEYFSSYLYLSMAAFFKSINMDGFAHWMHIQSQEELGHAMKLYGYIHEQQGRVLLSGIETPQTEWASPVAAFDAAYKHEQKITKLINELTDLAIIEKDHATHIFLNWFVSEQVEEEAAAIDIIQKLKMIGDSPQGLILLDRQLATRK